MMFTSRYESSRACWRGLCFLLLSVMVSSCAIQPGQQQAEEEETPVRPQYITVEASVQQNFDSAIALMKQENYSSAIDVLNNVVAAEKRLTAPYNNLAIAYSKTDDDKKARENIDLALAVDKHDAVANNMLGMLLRKQGKFEDARKAYSEALAKNPEYLPVIKNLGILCDIYLRDLECALEQFENYQAIAPDDRVKIWIADLKRRAGG